MDDNQKERLEQELKFLKESFEAEVISKEEFEKGKSRIERKLREIRKQEQKAKEPKAEEQKKDEAGEKSPIATKEGETIKLKVIQDENEHHEHEHQAPIQIKTIEKKEEQAQISKPKEAEKDSKFFKYAVVFVVLLLAVFFLYSLFTGNQDGNAKPAKIPEAKVSRTNILVINDRQNCFNCDTQRVLGILESWFGSLNATEVSYNSEQGRRLAEKHGARLLPFYILDENISKKAEFEKFRQAFSRRNDSYVMNEDASGSTLYFRRENIPNRLDLFVKGDDSGMKAENNLKEFLNEFSEVKYEKHMPSGNLARELNIRSFPTFLVNNRVKFSGIQTADAIKNNFCRLNKLPGCNITLSRSLI